MSAIDDGRGAPSQSCRASLAQLCHAIPQTGKSSVRIHRSFCYTKPTKSCKHVKQALKRSLSLSQFPSQLMRSCKINCMRRQDHVFYNITEFLCILKKNVSEMTSFVDAPRVVPYRNLMTYHVDGNNLDYTSSPNEHRNEKMRPNSMQKQPSDQ